MLFLIGAGLGAFCGSLLSIFVFDTADPKFSQAPALALVLDLALPLMASTVMAGLVAVVLFLRGQSQPGPASRFMFLLGILAGLVCEVVLIVFLLSR